MLLDAKTAVLEGNGRQAIRMKQNVGGAWLAGCDACGGLE
jgi:hypothetical protein